MSFYRAARHLACRPLLYLVVESNYCHFHVKEIRFHYANEASGNFLENYQTEITFDHSEWLLLFLYPLKVMLLLTLVKS